jgi:subtilisin family serine protease
VLAITTIASPAVEAAAQAATTDPVVSSSVTSDVKAGEKVRAIIEVKRGQSVRAVATDTEAASSQTEVINKTDSDEFLVATVDKKTLAEIKTDDRIKAIYEDELSKPSLAASTKVIGSDEANKRGWTGKGSTIAILDTGIDRDHPFFTGRIVDEACFSSTAESETYHAVSLCPNGTDTQTGPGAADAEIAKCMVAGANKCFHGTHVAGIAAGKKAGNAPSNGVAPDAGILPIQVFSQFTGTICGNALPCFLSFASDQKLALEYVELARAQHRIVAANMSLGSNAQHKVNCDDESSLTSQIAALKTAGVATVISSGNSGYEDGVGSPGCVSMAVTVGATDNSDAPAPGGNRGTLLDLFAPGVAINSSVPNNTFATMGGTSMAAPHVAGALALVRQAYPALTSEGLVERLRTTGKSITYASGDGNVTTKRIDLTTALPPRATPTPTVHPTVTPTPTATPAPTSTPTPAPTPTETHRTDERFDPQPVPDTCKRGKATKPLSAKQWAAEMHRKKGSLSDKTLLCYLSLAQNGSKVFPELTDAGSLGKAYKVLAPKSKTAKALLDRELLGAWLNYAHGVYNGSAKVHGSTTLKQAVGTAEKHRTKKGSSAQLKKVAVYLYRHVNK